MNKETIVKIASTTIGVMLIIFGFIYKVKHMASFSGEIIMGSGVYLLIFFVFMGYSWKSIRLSITLNIAGILAILILFGIGWLIWQII